MKKLIFTFLILFTLEGVKAQVNKSDILQNLEKNQPSFQQQQQQQQQLQQQFVATLKSASRLFADKLDLTSVILIIPADSVVDVLDSDSTYLKVGYGDYEGYIFKRDARISRVTVSATQPVQQNNAQQIEQPVEQQQVSRFTFLENKYGTNMASRLIAGKIWKGMSAEMVRDSWGKPFKINRIIGENIKEEWIYKNTWLYIENNTLVEWGPINR